MNERTSGHYWIFRFRLLAVRGGSGSTRELGTHTYTSAGGQWWLEARRDAWASALRAVARIPVPNQHYVQIIPEYVKRFDTVVSQSSRETTTPGEVLCVF